MMNVTRSGSWSRLRISFAARPTATRSRERQELDRVLVRDPLARDCALEDLGDGSPLGDAHATARSGGLDEAELRHGLEQPGVARELEERVEAGALARAEAVAELLEVAREEAGRIAVPLGRLVTRAARARHGRAAPTRRARPRAPRAPPRAAPGRPRPRTPSAAPSARARDVRGRGAASDPRTRSAAPRRRSGASPPPRPRLVRLERRLLGSRGAAPSSARRRRGLRRHRDRAHPLERHPRSRAGSSRRHPPRRRRAAAAAAACRRCARTRSRRSERCRARRATSIRFSSVGTPCTSSTSASTR